MRSSSRRAAERADLRPIRAERRPWQIQVLEVEVGDPVAMKELPKAI